MTTLNVKKYKKKVNFKIKNKNKATTKETNPKYQKNK